LSEGAAPAGEVTARADKGDPDGPYTEQTPGGDRRRQPPRGRFLRELPFIVLVAAAVVFVLTRFVTQAFYIPSESMEPQLRVGDRILVSKISYRLHDPRRGDIVVFDAPPAAGPRPVDRRAWPVRAVKSMLEALGLRAPKTQFIKRVIAAPGETVEARNGRVLVNGRELVEPYLPPGVFTGNFGPVSVPPRAVWLMGDNRTRSTDSRSLGPVRTSSLVGRTILRAWPPDEASFL
jgi:signal peptidase I